MIIADIINGKIYYHLNNKKTSTYEYIVCSVQFYISCHKGVKILARAWKDILQPWMRIDFSGNKMWDEWVKILAREWKNKLKPWMAIYLDVNKIL